MTVAELPLPVEVVPSDGYSLRLALHGGGVSGPTSPTPPSAPPRHRPVAVALGAPR